MHAIATSRFHRHSTRTGNERFMFYAGLLLVAVLFIVAALSGAHAATTTGTSLKGAFDVINDITNGYGKQLLVLVGFCAAGFAILASQATGAILKFIGFVTFLSVGLGAAVTLSGAVI